MLLFPRIILYTSVRSGDIGLDIVHHLCHCKQERKCTPDVAYKILLLILPVDEVHYNLDHHVHLVHLAFGDHEGESHKGVVGDSLAAVR